MPLLSAFTTFGHFAFSSETPRAQAIYESIRDGQGASPNEDFDSALSSRWYAQAMAIAAARSTLERAGNQADPTKVHELLPVQERMWGIIPPALASSDERRAALTIQY